MFCLSVFVHAQGMALHLDDPHTANILQCLIGAPDVNSIGLIGSALAPHPIRSTALRAAVPLLCQQLTTATACTESLLTAVRLLTGAAEADAPVLLHVLAQEPGVLGSLANGVLHHYSLCSEPRPSSGSDVGRWMRSSRAVSGLMRLLTIIVGAGSMKPKPGALFAIKANQDDLSALAEQVLRCVIAGCLDSSIKACTPPTTRDGPCDVGSQASHDAIPQPGKLYPTSYGTTTGNLGTAALYLLDLVAGCVRSNHGGINSAIIDADGLTKMLSLLSLKPHHSLWAGRTLQVMRVGMEGLCCIVSQRGQYLRLSCLCLLDSCFVDRST